MAFVRGLVAAFLLTGFASSSPITVLTAGSYGPNTWPGYVFGKATGIDRVDVVLQRATDQRYWDGSSWVANETAVAAEGISEWILPIKDLTPGSYTVTARASDPTIQSAAGTFVYDSTGPGVLSNLSANAYTSSTWPGIVSGTSVKAVGVSLQIRDTTSQKFWDGAKWDAEATWLRAVLLPTGVWTFPFTPTEKSTYGIRLNAVDAAGNTANVPESTFSFDVDTHPNSNVLIGGNLSAIKPIAGISTSQVVSVSVQRTPGSEWLNGTQWQAAEFWNVLTGTSWQINVAFEEGKVYDIRSKAKDEAEPFGRSTVLLDTTAPEAKLQMPAFLNAVDSVVGTANDPAFGAGLLASGVDHVAITIKNTKTSEYFDGSTWKKDPTWMTVFGTLNWKSPTIKGLEDGVTYEVQISVVDRAGNSPQAPIKGEFMFDTVAPEAMIVHVDKQVSGTATDAQSGVDHVEVLFKRDDGQYWNGTKWVGDPAWLVAKGDKDWSMTLPEGNITQIQARAFDKARNIQAKPAIWDQPRIDNAGQDSYKPDWQDKCGIGKSISHGPSSGSGPSLALLMVALLALSALRRAVARG